MKKPIAVEVTEFRLWNGKLYVEITVNDGISDRTKWINYTEVTNAKDEIVESK